MPELYSRYLELLGTGSQLLPALATVVPAIGVYYFSMDYVKRCGRAGCMGRRWQQSATPTATSTVAGISLEQVDEANRRG